MYIILISAAIVDIGGFNTPFEASGMLLFPLFLCQSILLNRMARKNTKSNS